MSISTTVSTVSYNGNGSTTVFTVPWLWYFDTDITVEKITGSTGVVSTLGLNVDYGLSGVGVGSGTCTIFVAPLGGSPPDIITIFINPPITQNSHYVANAEFPSAAVEENFDRNIQISQRLQAQINKSIRAPDADNSPSMVLPSALSRANRFAVFDAAGNVNTSAGSGTDTGLRTDLAAGLSTLVSPNAVGAGYVSTGIKYIQTPAELAAGVTPVNLFFPEGTVDRYQANTTPGTTNMFVGIQAAFKVCRAAIDIGNHCEVVFLKGTYNIVGTGAFNPDTSFSRGYVVRGAGFASTILKLTTSGGTNQFIYDNPTLNTQQAAFVTFKDLQFTTDNTASGGAFRVQQDQGFRFYRCWFITMSNVFEDHGATNGSEHRFYACKFTDIHGRVFLMDNQQCLNIEFHGCDPETIYGNIIEVTAAGGGALRVFGGSWIMDDGGSPKYLLNINGAGIGNNNNTYTFNGIQTELHAPNCRLVSCGDTGGGGAHIVFNNSNITATNGSREEVNITGCRLTFNRCVLTQNQGDTYTVKGIANGSDQMGDPGTLEFFECDVPQNLSTLINLPVSSDGLVWGYATARGCYFNGYVPSDPRFNRYAMDFDLNWYNGGRAQGFPGLKRVSVKPQNRNWPDIDSSQDWFLLLPNNALIVNIYVFRPAGARAQNYELRVGNGDKSVEYGNDGGGLQSNVSHTIIVQKTIATMISGGTTNPNNQVRVWANPVNTPSSDPVTGGYFIVEYY